MDTEIKYPLVSRDIEALMPAIPNNEYQALLIQPRWRERKEWKDISWHEIYKNPFFYIQYPEAHLPEEDGARASFLARKQAAMGGRKFYHLRECNGMNAMHAVANAWMLEEASMDVMAAICSDTYRVVNGGYEDIVPLDGFDDIDGDTEPTVGEVPWGVARFRRKLLYAAQVEVFVRLLRNDSVKCMAILRADGGARNILPTANAMLDVFYKEVSDYDEEVEEDDSKSKDIFSYCHLHRLFVLLSAVHAVGFDINGPEMALADGNFPAAIWHVAQCNAKLDFFFFVYKALRRDVAPDVAYYRDCITRGATEHVTDSATDSATTAGVIGGAPPYPYADFLTLSHSTLISRLRATTVRKFGSLHVDPMPTHDALFRTWCVSLYNMRLDRFVAFWHGELGFPLEAASATDGRKRQRMMLRDWAQRFDTESFTDYDEHGVLDFYTELAAFLVHVKLTAFFDAAGAGAENVRFKFMDCFSRWDHKEVLRAAGLKPDLLDKFWARALRTARNRNTVTHRSWLRMLDDEFSQSRITKRELFVLQIVAGSGYIQGALPVPHAGGGDGGSDGDDGNRNRKKKAKIV